jgi:ABC-type branched-subunit amino acid transport system permease subunit
VTGLALVPRPRLGSLTLVRGGGVLLAGVAGVLLPRLLTNQYWLHTASTALLYIVLALAFDLIFGRAGAFSLGQPLFYAFGAYAAALTAKSWGGNFWEESAFAIAATAVLGVLVGMPSFRLSRHAFAVGTLGFTLIGQLIATNWLTVTGGPLCKVAVPDLRIPYPGGSFEAITEENYYYVALAMAAVVVAVLAVVYRSRFGTVIAAVRDDDVLGAARGIAPTKVRLAVLGISAGLTAWAGVYAAHFQQVVCPTQGDPSVSSLLLVMVLVGGRGSTVGVVTAAVVFTVLPQVLRIADSWRLVYFAALLLLTVIFLPDGLTGAVRRPLAALVRPRAGAGTGDARR